MIKENEELIYENVIDEYFNLMKEISRKSGEQVWQEVAKIKFYQDIYEQIVVNKHKLSNVQQTLLADKKPIEKLYNFYIGRNQKKAETLSNFEKLLFNFSRESKLKND